MPFHSSVAVSKSALEGLTKSLAAELAPGIRVNAIAPSLVNTPLGERFINTPEKLSAIEKRNPMRKVGTPADIANMIHFLLSDQANWITGQVIGVDGGMNNIKL
jgi:NAD(P)-dependent dehydrogenase (short-subunit alcohol dehydrogenase family)